MYLNSKSTKTVTVELEDSVSVHGGELHHEEEGAIEDDVLGQHQLDHIEFRFLEVVSSAIDQGWMIVIFF